MQISLSNKLAALALAITDAAIAPEDDLAPTAVAALISAANTDPMSIGEIATIVGLTHSATVRMVDRLESTGLFRRQGRIGREVMVDITPAGRRRAEELQDRRLTKTSAFLTGLSEDEIAILSSLVERMLRTHSDSGEGRQRICRMCSRGNCNCCFASAMSGKLPPVPQKMSGSPANG